MLSDRPSSDDDTLEEEKQPGWYWRTLKGKIEYLSILNEVNQDNLLFDPEMGWQREED